MCAKKVLVVDDNAEFAEFVRTVAVEIGHDVEVCANGALAKDAYQNFGPETIVLDMVMPEVDGIEFVQWLASQNCTASLILVTGFNPNYTDVAKTIGLAKGLGQVTTLNKPVHLADLRQALSDDDG